MTGCFSSKVLLLSLQNNKTIGAMALICKLIEIDGVGPRAFVVIASSSLFLADYRGLWFVAPTTTNKRPIRGYFGYTTAENKFRVCVGSCPLSVFEANVVREDQPTVREWLCQCNECLFRTGSQPLMCLATAVIRYADQRQLCSVFGCSYYVFTTYNGIYNCVHKHILQMLHFLRVMI